eukprot:NODE_1955_length_1174_cov_51.077364_g1938_i0.p1 GENE.NODE_1955_length_1174_cov_51.077364_g1938_i0~~NODE_1955_length_1174_cov_51.077364_g1938_i0.p1  ORF type:complete len:323 (+),score=19.41 NODE_1955_length_1174_cov_51.077364_g1938_i0:43-1011(+)
MWRIVILIISYTWNILAGSTACLSPQTTVVGVNSWSLSTAPDNANDMPLCSGGRSGGSGIWYRYRSTQNGLLTLGLPEIPDINCTTSLNLEWVLLDYSKGCNTTLQECSKFADDAPGCEPLEVLVSDATHLLIKLRLADNAKSTPFPLAGSWSLGFKENGYDPPPSPPPVDTTLNMGSVEIELPFAEVFGWAIFAIICLCLCLCLLLIVYKVCKRRQAEPVDLDEFRRKSSAWTAVSGNEPKSPATANSKAKKAMIGVQAIGAMKKKSGSEPSTPSTPSTNKTPRSSAALTGSGEQSSGPKVQRLAPVPKRKPTAKVAFSSP